MLILALLNSYQCAGLQERQSKDHHNIALLVNNQLAILCMHRRYRLTQRLVSSKQKKNNTAE